MKLGRKIGLYADFYRPGTSGGIDGYFASLVRALHRYAPQHEWVILSQPENDGLIREQFPMARVHELNPPRWLNRVYRGMRRWVTRQRYNEHEQIERLGLELVIFPRQRVFVEQLRLPVVLHLFDIQHEYYPQFFTREVLAKRVREYRFAIERADAIIAMTDYTRRTIGEKFPGCMGKTRMIYPGLDETSMPSEMDLERVRVRYGLPLKFLYYPAQIWMHKNHARLFASLRRASEHMGERIGLVMTGQLAGENAQMVERLAQAAEVEGQIYNLGFVSDEDVMALYGLARGLIFPSLFEGFGYPILEAMRVGCVVACANGTCLPEIAGDGGLLFDGTDVGAMTEAVMRLWGDEGMRGSLRERGLIQATRFSWERSVRETVALYEHVIGG